MAEAVSKETSDGLFDVLAKVYRVFYLTDCGLESVLTFNETLYSAYPATET